MRAIIGVQMNKTFIISALSLLLSLPLYAQPSKNLKILCGPIAAVINELQKGYGEVAMVILIDDNKSITLTVNPTTATWTLVEIEIGSKDACILATGVGVLNPSKLLKQQDKLKSYL